MTFTCYLSCSQALSCVSRPGHWEVLAALLELPLDQDSDVGVQIPPGLVRALGLGTSFHLWHLRKWALPLCSSCCLQGHLWSELLMVMVASLPQDPHCLRGWTPEDLYANQACVYQLREQKAAVAGHSCSQAACENWDECSQEKC